MYRFNLYSIVLVLLALGCARELPSEVFAAEAALAAGHVALQERDFDEARTRFQAAIDSGALNADQHADALCCLAIVEAESGHIDAARAALDQAERGAADLPRVLAIRRAVEGMTNVK